MEYANAGISNAEGGTSGLQVLSVTELSRCIRGVIEAEDLFRDIWVTGEISNLNRHSSGHVYFCLKDENALIKAVIWRQTAERMRFDVSDGMNIVARGRVSVYERQGQYQLVVNEINPAGIGSLYIAYEQLKARLQEEGLFDQARKKELPAFPRKIAIITSPTGAALRDMVTVARRRMPSIDLMLIPTLVQGQGSDGDVSRSLGIADGLDADVIVVGRGGGSIEDLWSFNSEDVVRAICACRTPVVSAIGHETDFTLADFAADLRAPTPSAAMELIVPDRSELAGRINAFKDRAGSCLGACLARNRAALDILLNAPSFRYPEKLLQDRWQRIDQVEGNLKSAYGTVLNRHAGRLGELSASLQSLSPLGVLGRGYAVVMRSDDGTVVRRIADVQPGDVTETLVSDGKVISKTLDIKEGWT